MTDFFDPNQPQEQPAETPYVRRRRSDRHKAEPVPETEAASMRTDPAAPAATLPDERSPSTVMTPLTTHAPVTAIFTAPPPAAHLLSPSVPMLLA